MKKRLEISGILAATGLLVSMAIGHSGRAYDGCHKEWALKSAPALSGTAPDVQAPETSDFPFHVVSITTE